MTISSLIIASGESIIVGITLDSTTATVSSVKWNTTEDLTAISGTAIRTTAQYAQLWGLKNPTATTADVVITLSASVNAQIGACPVISVDQTTPFIGGTTASALFTTTLSSPVTCTSSDLAVDIVRSSSATNPTKGASQTIIFQPADSFFGFGASSQGGTNPTMTWTDFSAAVGSESAMCIKGAAGGATRRRGGSAQGQ